MSRSPRTLAARRAREKAEENGRIFAELQARLHALAVEFFTLQENTEAAKIDEKIAAKEKELEALRAKRAEAREEARRVLSAPVAEMKALKVSKDEIAARLGLTRAEVNALLRVSAKPAAERAGVDIH